VDISKTKENVLMAQKAKRYTRVFQESAVRLVEQSHDRPMSEVARDLDVNYDTLYGWVAKKAGKKRGGKAPRPGEKALPGQPETLEEEVRRLRRELSEAREERDFLKKAAAFFAKMNK
jgi:transposase